jgi:hypothetical protein
MERLPLHVLIGPAEEAVLYENEVIAGLTYFHLHIREQLIQTTFKCKNCFPRRSGQRLPSNAKEEFPLCFYIGDNANDTLLGYDGTLLGHLREIYIILSTASQRVVRLTFQQPLPDDLNTALLDLGVEVIVQSPDADSALGDVDAHL